jgi:hypothetical protein
MKVHIYFMLYFNLSFSILRNSAARSLGYLYSRLIINKNVLLRKIVGALSKSFTKIGLCRKPHSNNNEVNNNYDNLI